MEHLSQKSDIPGFRNDVKQFCKSQEMKNVSHDQLSALIATARESIFDYLSDRENGVVRDLGISLDPNLIPEHLIGIYSPDPCNIRPEMSQAAFVFGIFATTLLRLAETSSLGSETNFESFQSYANFLAKILDGNLFDKT